MAHLVCDTHRRRVVVTPTGVIHRNGDGSQCADTTLRIGRKVTTTTEVRSVSTGMALAHLLIRREHRQARAMRNNRIHRV